MTVWRLIFRLIEFSQHLRGEIDVHPLEGIHHLSARDFTLIRHACGGFGTDGLLFLTHFLHTGLFLLSWLSRGSPAIVI